MYVTNSHRMDDDEAVELVEAIGQGQIITRTEKGLDATWLPFVVHHKDDGGIWLSAHFTRVNAQWKGEETLVIVQGPTAFVSGLDLPPQSAKARVPRVPSVDYLTVHLRGRMKVVEDERLVLDHLNALAEKFEDTWRIDTHSDPGLVRKILPAIVMVYIEVDEVIGKWKLHQAMEPEEISYTAKNLRKRGTPEAEAIADLMEKKAIAWAKDRNDRKDAATFATTSTLSDETTDQK